MHPRQKIAFIKAGDFSHTNASVRNLLTENFPDFDIEEVDIFSDLMSKTDALALLSCLKEYGSDLLLGRKSIYSSFVGTPYFFHKLRRRILHRLANQEYVFTFQTQSLFDASIPGTPHFVYTDHTHLANLQYPGFDHKRLLSPSWLECESSIYHNATLNFTMSSNITKSIIEDYSCGADQVQCVYCGANVQVTEDEQFDEHRYSAKNILFVGKAWERKGGPVLVEAFRTVLGTHPDATLTIVGCAPRLSVPNCRIVGQVSLAEVKRYFKEASIFCLPSTREPFGIVYLEAMAHKLPVIACNIGALPDFIVEGKNGYLIEASESRQLSQSIERLISAPEECKTLGAYGHKLFWDRYTWEKTGVRIHRSIERFLTAS